MRYAMVDQTGAIVNVVEWDGGAVTGVPALPAGWTLVLDKNGQAQPDGSYDAKAGFIQPPPPPEPEPTLDEKVAALIEQVQVLQEAVAVLDPATVPATAEVVE